MPEREADLGRDNGMYDAETRHWLDNATLVNQPYLNPNPQTRLRTASDYPCKSTDDIKDDVDICRSRIERLGLDMLVLDQTRADIGIPVVKVVVPGLRHFRARFAPGRLYEVPVQLGLLSKPLSEVELNPIPVFL